MENGAKPLLFHTVHTSFVACLLVVSVVFGPCFGIDNMDEYTCFFHNGEYTLLSYFYGIPFVIFLLVLLFGGSFNSIPYCMLFWIRYLRNCGGKNINEGMRLTAYALLLIALHPGGTFYFSDMIGGYRDRWPDVFVAVIFVTIIIAIYYLPYRLIHLSYPQIAQNNMNKIYRAVIYSQLIVYLILIAYTMSPFPDAVKNFMDRKYLYWYHWQ